MECQACSTSSSFTYKKPTKLGNQQQKIIMNTNSEKSQTLNIDFIWLKTTELSIIPLANLPDTFHREDKPSLSYSRMCHFLIGQRSLE